MELFIKFIIIYFQMPFPFQIGKRNYIIIMPFPFFSRKKAGEEERRC